MGSAPHYYRFGTINSFDIYSETTNPGYLEAKELPTQGICPYVCQTLINICPYRYTVLLGDYQPRVSAPRLFSDVDIHSFMNDGSYTIQLSFTYHSVITILCVFVLLLTCTAPPARSHN